MSTKDPEGIAHHLHAVKIRRHRAPAKLEKGWGGVGANKHAPVCLKEYFGAATTDTTTAAALGFCAFSFSVAPVYGS